MTVNFKLKQINKIPVLAVTGRVVNTDSEKFHHRLEKLCSENEQTIAVDFTEASFIDSFGLGALVRCFTLMQKSGRELIIISNHNDPQNYFTRLFEMTGLQLIFKIVSSLETIEVS